MTFGEEVICIPCLAWSTYGSYLPQEKLEYALKCRFNKKKKKGGECCQHPLNTKSKNEGLNSHLKA